MQKTVLRMIMCFLATAHNRLVIWAYGQVPALFLLRLWNLYQLCDNTLDHIMTHYITWWHVMTNNDTHIPLWHARLHNDTLWHIKMHYITWRHVRLNNDTFWHIKMHYITWWHVKLNNDTMDHMMTEEHMLAHCLTHPVGSRHKHVVSALTEVRMKGNRLWMHVQLEQGNVHHLCMHNTFKSIYPWTPALVKYTVVM